VKTGDKLNIRERVRVKCTCGLWVVAGFEGPQDEPILLHPTPACEFYLKHAPDVFLRKLRKKYAL
jgi:hypothetical protein